MQILSHQNSAAIIKVSGHKLNTTRFKHLLKQLLIKNLKFTMTGTEAGGVLGVGEGGNYKPA